MADKIPITEFFTDEPLITPADFHRGQTINFNPQIKTAICTFMSEHIDQKLLSGILPDCRLLYYVYGRSGKIPLYQYQQQCYIVLMTVGSPVAAAVVEELKFLGVENIIAYGTAGLLSKEIPENSLVLIEKAIRDEGVSYHYLPPSLYVATDHDLSQQVAQLIKGVGLPITKGISWTTDALFRETSARCMKRRQQGAVVVEMECAGFAAACQRLGIRFCEFVFFSDSLTGPEWTMLGEQNTQDQRRSLKAKFLSLLIKAIGKINLPKL